MEYFTRLGEDAAARYLEIRDGLLEGLNPNDGTIDWATFQDGVAQADQTAREIVGTRDDLPAGRDHPAGAGTSAPAPVRWRPRRGSGTPRHVRPSGSPPTWRRCGCSRTSSGPPGRRSARSRRCWPAGRGGVRCPRCSTRPTTATPSARAELRALVDDEEWAAAQRTTLNAHYTDPRS